MRVVFRWQSVSPSHSLPIDEILPQIIHSLRDGANLVIEAPPGAGKTTRVPPALLEIVRGEVVVLEPRRIVSRLAARRVASAKQRAGRAGTEEPTWLKIRNREYSQWVGREELFERERTISPDVQAWAACVSACEAAVAAL
jgi:HrpA-like RNA helicase